MKRMTKFVPRVLALAVIGVLAASCAGGQMGPPPKPGQEVATWVQMEQGYPGQTIYFRNDSNRPIIINQLEIYDCMNIGRSGCQFFNPGLIIQPRGVAQAFTLMPANRDRPFSFAYRYNYAEATE